MDYRKTSHAVYDIKYHLVWITKYRKPILRGEIALHLRELIRQTCATLDVYIEKGHSATGHLHLLVSVPPQVSVSDLMQRLKGRSSRLMLSGKLARRKSILQGCVIGMRLDILIFGEIDAIVPHRLDIIIPEKLSHVSRKTARCHIFLL